MESLPTFLKGYFLMAMPALMDPNFHQSVTCITEHTEEGAVGIVVNRVHEGLIAKMIFEELGMDTDGLADSVAVHIGGPVHGNELFVLHGPPLEWGQSLIIGEELALSNSREILQAIAQGSGPASYIIALGCAGWAPGQLEWELNQNAWLVAPCNREILFRVPLEQRWERAIQQMGIDPQALTHTAGHA
jgi:putative transcriptional regulator